MCAHLNSFNARRQQKIFSTSPLPVRVSNWRIMKEIKSDLEFILAFETGDLPKEDWTHSAHVRMTWYYLKHFNYSDAIHKIRSGIKNFVTIKGLNSSGYSETITLVYVHLIEFARRSRPLESGSIRSN